MPLIIGNKTKNMELSHEHVFSTGQQEFLPKHPIKRSHDRKYTVSRMPEAKVLDQ